MSASSSATSTNCAPGQFGSSTDEVQAAVHNRFRQEKTLALNMLDGGGRTALA